MRVLVTGAGGFVGGHLCEHLAAAGDEVYGTVWPVRTAADTVPGYGETRLIPCNMTDYQGVEDIVAEVRPEGVIHLAGIAFVPTTNRFPRQAYETNFIASWNLLRALKEHTPAARTVVVASADIYGAVTREQLPINEATPLAPISPYGLSKAALDLLGYQFWAAEGLPVMRVRPFNHIGPRQGSAFVAASFARQLVLIDRGELPPRLKVGDLSAIRDFTDVRDIVTGYRLLLERGTPGEAYNLCSGKGITIQSLLDRLVALSDTDVAVETVSDRLRARDIPELVGDNSKIRAALGWCPAVALETTLQDIFQDWKENA